jgi:hypothetical protein
MTFRALTSLIAAVACATAVAQEAPTPDETARFLAGLPVRNTVLEPLARQQSWMDHATEFDKAWKELDARQLAKIRAWGPEFLGDGYAGKGPVFYMFSGPDILYAQTFFPRASTYVLAGLEPVGPVPDISHLTPSALNAGLANLRKSLNSVLSFSFFITKDMKVDLRQNQLGGTLPILYVFLARSGSRVEKVQPLGLNPDGSTMFGKSATPGVKITFFGPSGAQQTLYYFETDLSNEGIKHDPGFIRFCEQLGPGRSFVKAASYLMHTGEFSKVRDFLLSRSSLIVQDDSGIPLRDFAPANWKLRFFGSYHGPIELFKQFDQEDLTAAYAGSHAPALPFGVGYRWHPSESSLILATPREPAPHETQPKAEEPTKQPQ